MKLLLCILLTSFYLSNAKDLNNEQPILVILQFKKQEESYSQFINAIKNEGRLVRVIDMDTPVTFESYGEYHYHSVFILAPKYPFKQITKEQLRDFVAKGRNVFISLSQVYTSPSSQFLQQFHVSTSPLSMHLEDSTHAVSSPIIFETESMNNPIFPHKSITYKGISFELPKRKQSTLSFTKDYSLIFAFQSLTNGRLVGSGSIDMFNNTFYEHNMDCIKTLIQWTIQNHGKLILSNINIDKIDGVPDIENEGMYFINDTIKITFDINQIMNGIESGYVADDVQIEYRYVTPVIRDFALNYKNGSYEFTTVLPDQFGVYTIKLNYTRPMLSALSFEKVTPIRPQRHDHVERFQQQCYPFYLAWIGMLFSTIIFVFLYVSYKEPATIKKD
ncbi:Dolichyl-diphosphooligosaccharide--protein glycosyltransferase 48 kDa subunit [Entamoeba marina]